MDTARVKHYLESLQTRIVDTLQALDGKPFVRDTWTRAPSIGGGGGLTCILEDGHLLERGGVGFSHVFGQGLPPSASANRPELAGRSFEAVGVSLVLHPRNPYVPTVHMNVRFFCAIKEGAAPVWWFGGGMDLDTILRLRRRRAAFSSNLPRRAGAVRRGPASQIQKVV